MSAEAEKMGLKHVKRFNFAAYAYGLGMVLLLAVLYALNIFEASNKTHLIWTVIILVAAVWNFVVFKRNAIKFQRRLGTETDS